MNETVQTLSDLPKDEQEFAEIIIEFIEKREEGVSLEDICFGIVCAWDVSAEPPKKVFGGIGNSARNTGIPELQEIAKIQGNPNENLRITAERMLDLFCKTGQIERHSEGKYRLRKSGLIYKHIADKLAKNVTGSSAFDELVTALNDLNQEIQDSESIKSIHYLLTTSPRASELVPRFDEALKACNLDHLDPRVDRLRLLLERLRD